MLNCQPSLILQDTGLLYRAVGYGAVRRGIALDAEESLVALCNSLSPEDLADPGLRGDEAAQAASKVSVSNREGPGPPGAFRHRTQSG